MPKLAVLPPYNDPTIFSGLVSKGDSQGTLLQANDVEGSEAVLAAPDEAAARALDQLAFTERMYSFVDTVMNQRPLGYWKMNEASGAFADSSGNGYNSVAVGELDVTRNVAGLIAENTGNGALKFNTGINNNYVDLAAAGSPFEFEGTTSFTFALTFRMDQVGTNYLMGTPQPGDTGHLLFASATQLAYRRTSGATQSANNYTIPGAGWVAGATYRLGVTYDGTTNTSVLYLNGVGVSATVHTTVPSVPAYASTLTLGNVPGRSNSAVGVMDEVTVFNRALTSTEMYMQYVSGKYGA